MKPLNVFASASRADGGWWVELRLESPTGEPWTLRSSEASATFQARDGFQAAGWQVTEERLTSRAPFRIELSSASRKLRVGLDIPAFTAQEARLNLPVVVDLSPVTYGFRLGLSGLNLLLGLGFLSKAFQHPQPPGIEWFYGIAGGLSLAVLVGLLGTWMWTWGRSTRA